MTKPARFILNSDYTTVRKTGEYEMSVTIPNDFTTPANPHGEYYTIGQKTITIPNVSDTFFMFTTSSRYDYATPGWYGSTLPTGATVDGVFHYENKTIYFEISVEGSTAKLIVECLNPMPEGTARWRGYGQTITAHILTFKDPFTE